MRLLQALVVMHQLAHQDPMYLRHPELEVHLLCVAHQVLPAPMRPHHHRNHLRQQQRLNHHHLQQQQLHRLNLLHQNIHLVIEAIYQNP